MMNRREALKTLLGGLVAVFVGLPIIDTKSDDSLPDIAWKDFVPMPYDGNQIYGVCDNGKIYHTKDFWTTDPGGPTWELVEFEG